MSKSMAERAREARGSNRFQVDNVENPIVSNDESIGDAMYFSCISLNNPFPTRVSECIGNVQN